MRYNDSRISRNRYVHGSAAPKYDIRREMEKKPSPIISEQTRKNREKAKSMNMGAVVIACFVVGIIGAALFGELYLQSQNADLHREIASMQSELNNLKMENDEEHSRIMGSVDMQSIKERAITELNMQYAQSGQVIVVADASDDYVHQYQDLP